MPRLKPNKLKGLPILLVYVMLMVLLSLMIASTYTSESDHATTTVEINKSQLLE